MNLTATSHKDIAILWNASRSVKGTYGSVRRMKDGTLLAVETGSVWCEEEGKFEHGIIVGISRLDGVEMSKAA